MKVDLIRIGNSRAIRIPKPVIKQCGFGDTAELRIEHDQLIIAPDRKPRQDWEKAFRSAGSTAADELLLDAIPPDVFDRK
jgi:antitoxin MazE